jgi:ribonuclease BN (tRNA processing enzyme)
MIKKELIKHVKDSFWLDLAYDEENRSIITEKGLKLIIDELGDQRSIPPLPNQEDPLLWFEHFKRLKLIRVMDGLDLNEACRNYADLYFKFDGKKFKQKEFKTVKNGAEQRDNNLDKITWRCSAAIDRILEYYEAKHKGTTSQKPAWATLLALYHSELCASASAEVSFGWARRQNFVLKEEAVGFKIFQWIAKNNVSRGYNHLDDQLSAVKGFDSSVDTFNCKELSKELGDEHGKVNKENEDMLHRLLYMPAILTLAQSLGDLQRHSERRYYLNEGLKVENAILEKNARDYWGQVFSLHLSLATIDTGLESESHETHDPESTPPTNSNSIPPRTKSLSMQEEIQHAELKMRTVFGKSVFSENQMLESWLQCTSWLRLWHSAEPKSFLAGLQTTAEFLVVLLKRAKKSAKKSQPEVDSFLPVIEKAIDFLIKTQGFMTTKSGLSDKKIRSLKYLLGDLMDRKPKPMDFREIWRSGSLLLGCLNTLCESSNMLNGTHSQEMAKLMGWRDTLAESLNWTKRKGAINSDENQFRSEIEHLKLFPPPTTHKCAQQNGRVCNDDCFQKVMNKPLPLVAKLQTYKRAMYSQQKRFLAYLKFRTDNHMRHRTETRPGELPDFELISLRRWNSFSPNLGSRAAASVGGGYLIRLWHKNRYLGVAVDPGYNFLENLFNEGFTIADIDIVVVTHAHPDHTENLTNLFTLLFERNKRMEDEEKQNGINPDSLVAPIDHRVFLLITEGVFERYQSMLPETKTYIRDVVVLKAHADWRGSKAGSVPVKVSVCSDNNQCCIELDTKSELAFEDNECVALIQAKKAWHDDQTGHDSIGIVVTCRAGSNQPKMIGILGDSKYHEDLYLDYRDCSVLIAHLGSLISKRYYERGEEYKDLGAGIGEKIIKDEAHLYLPGLTRLICDLKNNDGNNDFPLLVLSEFGEELRGGLRKDLTNRLAKGLGHDAQKESKELLPIIPADVGLRIDIGGKRIFCSICHNYFAWGVIEAVSVLPHEEALAFVCEDCRLLRVGELPRLIEDWCMTGRPVIPLNGVSGSTE